MEHGHTWSDIVTYAPHMIGRFVVAAHRIDEQRGREQAVSAWVSSHADFKGLQSFVSSETKSAGKKQDREITPEQSRKAAIGLMNALNMR